jgi:drug/metabolite transporter (DMT)-like permease
MTSTNLVPLLLSLATASLGTVIYHLAARTMPQQANPAMVLVCAYLVGALLSGLALIFSLRGSGDGRAPLMSGIGWPTVAFGVAVVLIEFGFLWMYRSGWGVSIGALSVNITATVILIAVGLLAYREVLTPANWAGIGFCVVGLVLLTYRPSGA